MSTQKTKNRKNNLKYLLKLNIRLVLVYKETKQYSKIDSVINEIKRLNELLEF